MGLGARRVPTDDYQPRKMLAALLSVADAALGQGGVSSDVRYIKCAACEAAVAAAHRQVAALGKKASEESAMQLVESLCKPDAKEGSWMQSIDLVEEDAVGGGRRLALVTTDSDGPCGQECHTVALACEAAIDGIENELGEALYASVRSTSDASSLAKRACREWSTACKKSPPKLDPSRPDGPAFRAYTLEERGRREASGPPPPGVLTGDQVRAKLGLASSSAEVSGGDLAERRMGFRGPSDLSFDDGPREGEEAHGRGDQFMSPHHSAAFVEA